MGAEWDPEIATLAIIYALENIPVRISKKLNN